MGLAAQPPYRSPQRRARRPPAPRRPLRERAHRLRDARRTRPAGLRLSPHYYNTHEDVERTLAALRKYLARGV
ncbi:MAG TPA: hypothetical protein VM364_05650 [Vicinamibacterales bacterium]|nr:hypothetical protein [Vicinamibacterales bacterium]